MKLAIVTIDGKNISQHFGRSPYYKILTIEKNKIVNEELRERQTGHFAKNQQYHEHSHFDSKGKHGYGAGADAKHASMAAEISDCKILIAGGMGAGAYESFTRAGLNIYLTDFVSIYDAADELIKGKLKNLADTRTDELRKLNNNKKDKKWKYKK